MMNFGVPSNPVIGNGYPGLSQQSQRGAAPGYNANVPPQMTGGAGYTANVPQQAMGSKGYSANVPPQVMSGATMTPSGQVLPTPQFEQSYIENILRLNLGKQATFYMTYENNSQWNAKIFTGVIEAAGRDHIVISERQSGRRLILLMVNLDYVVFDEPLNYQYPGVIGNPPPTGR
ncbi:spore coat protein GerQ [Paenibacillus sp. JSM ZJ436]|uniref:spore coat protein GerQ n=1 Tax=Paenibacillus sp. JSM ZJ436 TaxID=3376190 RepID=UPI00378FF45A